MSCLLATVVVWALAGVALAASPSISGTLRAGQTLTVTGTDPTITYSYAWTSGGGPVGTNSASYTVASTDIGNEIAVTLTDASGLTVLGPLSAGVVPAPPANAGGPAAPTITGAVVQQGRMLTASAGTWTGTPNINFSYAWTSGGLPVGTDLPTYTPTLADVGKLIGVAVTATNAGGGPVTVPAVAVGPVLPLPPTNAALPAIAGTPQQGQVLTVTPGAWLNTPTSSTEQWEDCAALVCNAIPGQNGSTYTVGPGDVGHTIQVVETAFNGAAPLGVRAASGRTAAASATSATSVVAYSQNTPTANQGITLVATVISNSPNASPHGSLSFFNGSDAIHGCGGKGVSGRQTIIIVCQAGFPAGVAQISAAYVADPGSLVAGSSSDTTPVSIGKGPTSVSLAVTPEVAPGGRATYVATLEVPVSDAGPTLPSGSIDFLDGGQPIGACASQALSNLTATCSVGYPSTGTHSISAFYSGDANFAGSTSSASGVQIVEGAARAPTVHGTLGSTLSWKMFYHPHYSELIGLEAYAVAKGTSILVECRGRGCPFATWHLAEAASSINLLSRFRHRHLRAGTRITVRMTRRQWVGKSYSFTIRAGRGPMVMKTCLAPGGAKLVACPSHSR